MAQWFDPTDIPVIWPQLDLADQPRVTRWIDQSERLILQRFPTVPTRINDGKLDVQVVADVVEAMVTRALDRSNRSGLNKLSYPEVAMEWDDSGGAGQGSILYLTVDELLLLAPSLAEGATTIRPVIRPRYPL